MQSIFTPQWQENEEKIYFLKFKFFISFMIKKHTSKSWKIITLLFCFFVVRLNKCKKIFLVILCDSKQMKQLIFSLWLLRCEMPKQHSNGICMRTKLMCAQNAPNFYFTMTKKMGKNLFYGIFLFFISFVMKN